MFSRSLFHASSFRPFNGGALTTNVTRALQPKRTQFTWSPPHSEDTLSFAPEEVFSAGVRHHHRCNTAFPLHHSTTIKPYRVRRLREQEDIRKVLQGAYDCHKEIMLYVHVPFCHTRCQFCEYTVVNPKVGRTADAQTVYFDALMDEFKLYDELLQTGKKKLVGFDIGGGTPSMASTKDIERIMTAAQKHFNLDLGSSPTLEVSIETTPKIAAAEPEKIRAYYQMGIRRISMGLQTTDFKQAKELGRDDANAGIDYVRKAVENIREAGFKSFNIDLMYGFPLRANREDPWAGTVRDAISLAPDHITLYRMRYKGTSMEHLSDRVGLDQVNIQEATARRILLENGYTGWTGKNTYSKTAGSSGCSDYLDKRVVKAVPYLGLGLGAQSFSHHTLSYNLGAVTKKMEQYIRSLELQRLPIQDLYHLGQRAAMAKMASVSFYFGGIDLDAFKHCFGVELKDVFGPEMKFVLERQLMVLEPNRLQLTALGKKHFGGVIALFYSPSVQNYVVNLPGGEAFARDPLAIIDDKIKSGMSEEEAAVKKEESISFAVSSPITTQSDPFPTSNQTYSTAMGLETWKFDPKIRTWVQMPTSSAPFQRALSTSTRIRSFSTSSSSSAQSSSSSSSSSGFDYEFGNILFGGECNQKCPFCIGKQLDSKLSPKNLRTWPIANLDLFTQTLKETKTKKMIFTGTRTDPQLYKFESRLVDHFRNEMKEAGGCHISLHTNGMLAMRKLEVFNKYDTVTISMNSFVPSTWTKLHGVKESNMPNLKEIIASSSVPIKLSCIVTTENYDEVKSGDYLQVVRSLGLKRIAFRHLFWSDPSAFHLPHLELTSEKKSSLFSHLTPVKYFCGNPVYNVDGIEVTHWVFDKTTGKSLNLFSDGTISEEYLLAKAPGNRLSSSSSSFSISASC